MTQGWPKARASSFLCCPHLPSLKQKARQCAFLVLLLQFYIVWVSISASEPASESIAFKGQAKRKSRNLCPLLSRTSTSACFQLPPSHAPRSTLRAPRFSPACLPLPLWAATLPSPLPKCASLVRPILQIVQSDICRQLRAGSALLS
jgi:hypothetical protein